MAYFNFCVCMITVQCIYSFRCALCLWICSIRSLCLCWVFQQQIWWTAVSISVIWIKKNNCVNKTMLLMFVFNIIYTNLSIWCYANISDLTWELRCFSGGLDVLFRSLVEFSSWFQFARSGLRYTAGDWDFLIIKSFLRCTNFSKQLKNKTIFVLALKSKFRLCPINLPSFT